MKISFNKYVRITTMLFLALIMISGCNNSSSSSIGGNGVDQASAYFKGQNLSHKATVTLDINWTVDGFDFGSAAAKNTPFLFDVGWHLLTLTVQNQSTPLPTPVAINGLQWAITPAPTDQRGESVQIMDINCRTAQFSKNGDSCSAYVRIYYDYNRTGITNPPTIYAQFATNAYPNLANMYEINVEPLLDRMQGDYRTVLPIESIGGSNVLSNPVQYQVLQMQNISLPYIVVSQVTPLSNPNFTLMHRTTSASSDPYYGAESECNPTPTPGLGQTNILPNLNSTCILVYQAAASTTQTVESDYVTLASTAEITAPWTTNTFNLIANYATGHPIPESDKFGSNFIIASGSAHPNGTDMIMDSHGDLVSGTVTPSADPFNLVNISYDFSAGNLIQPDSNHQLYTNGIFNIAENCTPNRAGETCVSPVQAGMPLLTDGSTTNPVTVTQIIESVQDSASSPGNATSVNACGGAWTSSGMSFSQTAALAENNQIHIYVGTSSHALCGNMDHSTFEGDIPLYGYNNVVYNVDQQGCGGNTWDIGGKVTVTGPGCNYSANQCKYTLVVEAWHGGTSGQCQDHEQKSFDVTFDKPQVYAQVMVQNFNLNSQGKMTYLAVGGQNLSAWFGGQGTVLAQGISCIQNDLNHNCTINGMYQNGTSATAMSYQPGNLQPGDALHQGRVNFNRSEGYDLTSFISPHKSQE